MNRTATFVVAGLCAALPGRPLAAQHPVEYGLHAVATFATPDLVAGGGYAAVRSGERARLALTLAAGTADGDVAFRGELLGAGPLVRASEPATGIRSGEPRAVARTDCGWLV